MNPAMKTWKTGHNKNRAFTLIELMVALVIGLVLLLLIVKIFSGVSSGNQLQKGLARIQENGRIAMYLVNREVRKAGFRTKVWVDPLIGYHPITANSVNGTAGGNDTLQIMYLDARNCSDVLNTTIDTDTGDPLALYKQITFTVDANENLQWSCEYGDSPTALTMQISNQIIIEGAESFQILYGVDTDLPTDFSVNKWETANNISPETSICLQSQYLCSLEGLAGSITNGVPVSLQIGLLLRSPEVVGGVVDSQTFNVLDVAVPAANDNRIRKLYTTTIALRNLSI
jgi:type IV pilus assembly protein PilW